VDAPVPHQAIHGTGPYTPHLRRGTLHRPCTFPRRAVLYEMLAGKRAFGGESAALVLRAILQDDPPRLEAPAALERIVRRCLAKRLVERFQNIAEVRTALEQIFARPAEGKRAEQLLQDLGDGNGYGAPLEFIIYHNIRLEFAKLADWAEKAIEQRDPNILPATCGPNRKFLIANGRWPALARMLNLSETATPLSS
jgi:hypothetical protein